MSEATVVDARLDKLERDNWRLKLTVSALLLVLAAVPLIGAVMPEQIPEVIRARAFHAIDGNGMSRAVMGEIGFAYFDVNRTIRAMMDGGSIRVLDENGTLRARIDRSGIDVRDENNNLRVMMTTKSGFAYWDENDNLRATMDYDGILVNDARIRVLDGNGTLRALMDDKNIAYLDENRVTRAQLYADGFFLSDENGNVVWRSPER